MNLFKISYVRNILVITVVITATLLLFNTLFVYPKFTKILMNVTESEAVHVAQALMRVFLANDYIAEPTDLTVDRITNEMIAEIGLVSDDFGLMKLKIFSKDGKTIYSTDAGDIGKVNTKPYFYEIADKGGSYSKLIKKNNQSLEGEEIPIDVVETYVPVLRDGLIIGVFEIYYDITDRRIILEKLLKESKFVLGCILIFFVTVLVFVLNKTGTYIAENDRMKTEAESASEAKSLFLANMSHEIRTPMNGVVGMIHLLADTGLSAKQNEYVDSALLSSGFLLTVINDILDYSKIEAGKLELETIDFDLSVMLESINDLMAVKVVEKEIEFASIIHENVPVLLKGDPGRLRQIINNLAGNAIKFVENGEVSIQVTLKNETKTHVRLLFEVKDTGIGIAEDRIQHLFNSFSQVDASTNRRYGGTGLGLAISKQLVGLMAGQIGVESKEGEGSTFWFEIELEKQFNVGEKISALPEEIKGKKILVVDDNSTSRQVFTEYLKAWGCRFDIASDGKQAIALLRDAVESGDRFQVALLDMVMPVMDGETLGIKIKEEPTLSDTILIMVTAFGMRGDAGIMKKIGFSAYLTKPVKKMHLFDCLRTVYDKSDKKSDIFVTRNTIEEKKISQESQTPFMNILLVEDNKMNQKVAVNMLKKMGHTVCIANNGKEAVSAFQEDSFNIILMDIQMPVMDGIEATSKIRKIEELAMDKDKNLSGCRVPIIAFTANAMKGDKERYLAADMDDYIPKPFHKKNFTEVIKRVGCFKDQDGHV